MTDRRSTDRPADELTPSEVTTIRKILNSFVIFSDDEVRQIKKILAAYHHLSWFGKVITNILIWGMTLGFGLPQIIELIKG